MFDLGELMPVNDMNECESTCWLLFVALSGQHSKSISINAHDSGGRTYLQSGWGSQSAP
jgi:hypothetical protein